MTIYVAVVDINYGGSTVECFYTSRQKARLHQFSYGDRQRIEKWVVNQNGVGRKVSSDVLPELRRKKPKK